MRIASEKSTLLRTAGDGITARRPRAAAFLRASPLRKASRDGEGTPLPDVDPRVQICRGLRDPPGASRGPASRVLTRRKPSRCNDTGRRCFTPSTGEPEMPFQKAASAARRDGYAGSAETQRIYAKAIDVLVGWGREAGSPTVAPLSDGAARPLADVPTRGVRNGKCRSSARRRSLRAASC